MNRKKFRISSCDERSFRSNTCTSCTSESLWDSDSSYSNYDTCSSYDYICECKINKKKKKRKCRKDKPIEDVVFRVKPRLRQSDPENNVYDNLCDAFIAASKSSASDPSTNGYAQIRCDPGEYQLDYLPKNARKVEFTKNDCARESCIFEGKFKSFGGKRFKDVTCRNMCHLVDNNIGDPCCEDIRCPPPCENIEIIEDCNINCTYKLTLDAKGCKIKNCNLDIIQLDNTCIELKNGEFECTNCEVNITNKRSRMITKLGSAFITNAGCDDESKVNFRNNRVKCTNEDCNKFYYIHNNLYNSFTFDTGNAIIAKRGKIALCGSFLFENLDPINGEQIANSQANILCKNDCFYQEGCLNKEFVLIKDLYSKIENEGIEINGCSGIITSIQCQTPDVLPLPNINYKLTLQNCSLTQTNPPLDEYLNKPTPLLYSNLNENSCMNFYIDSCSLNTKYVSAPEDNPTYAIITDAPIGVNTSETYYECLNTNLVNKIKNLKSEVPTDNLYPFLAINGMEGYATVCTGTDDVNSFITGDYEDFVSNDVGFVTKPDAAYLKLVK